jgi:hypothetical protein
LGVGLQPYPVKEKIVEKPPRNSAGFLGGSQGLSWAVEPRKEEKKGVHFVVSKLVIRHHETLSVPESLSLGYVHLEL